MLPPSLLARTERLEFEARTVVEGCLAGRHRSPRKGFAVEFAQHREYTPGDDIRHMDWKVFARTERFHLKQFEQETNLVAWLIMDGSESMRVGTLQDRAGEPITKYHTASILAGAFAHLIARQGDMIGLRLYGSQLRTELKPKGGNGQVRELLTRLAEGPFPEPANAGTFLHDFASRAGLSGRRSVVLVFSDLLDEPEAFLDGLRKLRSLKNDVVVFQVLDAAEVDFPFRDPTLFQGLEGTPDIPTEPDAIRASYLESFAEHQRLLESVCRSEAIDLVRVRTDDDLAAIMIAYLRKRSRG